MKEKPELSIEDKKRTLENFMKEFFPYKEFKKAGLFTNEMKGDYEAQAKKVCSFLGLKSVYEYRSKEIKCHISYTEGHRPEGEPFVTTIPSIWDL